MMTQSQLTIRRSGPILAALLLSCSTLAEAAVITVGVSGCDFTDLQSAIDAANAGDELRLREQVFSDVNINIGKDLVLRGGYSVCGDDFPGLGQSSSLVGSPTAADSTVEIFGSTPEVTLARLEISGGTTDNDHGGGIEVGTGGILTLATVTVTGNESALGGGIFLEPDATLRHSGAVTVSMNSADDGGGIYASEGALIDFTSGGLNPVDIADNDGLRGAGIYLAEAAELRTHSNRPLTVSGGLALSGGGIYAATSALIDAPAMEILANEAVQGGGLYVAGGGTPVAVTTMVLGNDVRFQGNSATHGGAVHLGQGGGYSVELSGTCTQNSATQNGGAIYFDGGSGGALHLSFLNLASNQAGARGGGFYQIGGETTSDFLSVQSNHADLNGGGIYLNDAIFDADRQNLIFRNTAGDSGGGIALVSGSELRAYRASGAFIHFSLQDNEAQSGDGGGIYLQSSTMFLEWARIGGPAGGNRAPAGNGGGIYADTAVGWSIENFLIQFNHAGSLGGAVYATGGGFFNLRGLPVQASVSGKGLDDVPTCDAFNLDAGTFCADLRENSSGFRAGGVYVDGVDAILSRVALLDNTATTSGVALYVTNGSATLRHSLLARNGPSSAVFTGTGGDLEFSHVSVVDNEAAGVVANDANALMQVDKSLFWGNGAAGLLPAAGQVVTGSCNLGSGSFIPDAINADPLLVQTSRGRYRLGEASPAVDACDFGSLTLGLDGVTRPTGVDFDIGALEGEWIIPEQVFKDGFESP